MEKNLPSVVNCNTNGWKKTNSISFKKLSLTVFMSAFVFLVGMVCSLRIQAQVSVTTATSGTSVSADSAVNASTPSYTTLTPNIVIQEVGKNNGDFTPPGGTLTLTAPSGWTFNPGVGTISFAPNNNISSLTGISITSTTVSVTINVSGTNKLDVLTISGLQVRAVNGANIPSSGNITTIYSGTINGLPNGTNVASLTQVAGAAKKLAFTTQPANGTVGSRLTQQPVIKTQDQFGNSSTASLAATLNTTTSLSSGTGPLTGTLTNNIGTTGGNGTTTYTDLQINTAGTDKVLTVTATGLTSAVSNVFTVNKRNTTTTLTSSNNPSCSNTSTTLTASVTSGGVANTGSVQFFDGAASLGTSAVSGGTATLAVSSLTAAGSHSLTAVYSGDANYLTSTSAAITQTVASSPSANISYSGTPYCSNAGTATVTRTGSAGGTYSSTTGLIIDQNTGTVTLGTSTPGTYTVTYNIPANGGCSAFSTTASITITQAPSATISYSSSTYCSNAGTATVTRTGTSGGTYSSTSGLIIDQNTGTVTLGTSTTGTYTVTYTIAAANGCSAFSTTTSITITQAPSATISYSGSPYCSNAGTATVTRNGSTGGTYSSTTGLSISSTTGDVNLSASTAGTYTATYTIAAANGCSAFSTTASITITQAPSATISYSGAPFCSNGGTATVTRTGTSGGTYSSTSGLTISSTSGNIDLSASTPGAYTVSYTMKGSNGCSDVTSTTSITISTAPTPTITANGSTTFCAGGSVTLTSSSATTYQWFKDAQAITGATTQDYIANASGNYTVTVANAAGCTGTSDATTVTVNARPTAAITSSNTTICSSGGGTNITGTVTAIGNWTLTLSNGSTDNGSGNGTFSINVTPTTTTTYTISSLVSPTCNATNLSGSVTVTVTQAPVINTQPRDTTVCATKKVSFTVAATGDGLTYQWYRNNVIVTNTPNITGATTNTLKFTRANINDNGAKYKVVVSGTSPCSPVTSAEATLNVDQAIAITQDPKDTTVCTGSPVTFTVAAGSGTDVLTYQWRKDGVDISATIDNPSPITSSLQLSSVTSSDAGDYDVVISGITNFACPDVTSAPATLTVSPNATIALTSGSGTNAQTACISTPVTNITYSINNASGATFAGLPSGVTGSYNSGVVTISGTPDASGTFNYTVTPTGGCGNAAANGTITVNDAIPVSVNITASAATICAGTSVTFTATSTNGGTAPSYQWKVNGTNAGTNQDTYASSTLKNGDKVTVVLTSDATPCATGNPATSNSITITVNPNLPVSVSISTTTPTICAGTSVTFTAAPTNGGTAPSYQWKVNGANAGTDNVTFTTSTLADNDKVTAILTSSASPCATGSPATSNSITETVNLNLPVSVSIGASATTICAGTSVTFTATPTNGGSAPSYQWKVNGTNSGSNSATFTTSTLANNDAVTVVLTSNATPCASGNPATSNSITETVNPALPVSVSIGASSTTICAGTSVTFTATPTNGGSAPSYQWKVNGTNAGTNSATFTTSTLTNNNTVTVVLTSNATPCATGSPATSNTITETVNPNLPVSVSISTTTPTICAGASVTFTATPTNGGLAPSYQWKVNGANAGTNQATFTTSTLINGDAVTVVLTSNATPCATGNPATSNTVTITVNSTTVGGSVTSDQIVCSGSTPSSGLTLSGQTGSVVRWEKSTNTSFTSPTIIANTTTALSASSIGSLSVTTYFRAVVQSGNCSAVNSNYATITINQPFTPTITASPASPASPVCSGTVVTLTAMGLSTADSIFGGDFSQANPTGWNGYSGNGNNGSDDADWAETNGPKTFNNKSYNSTLGSGGKFMIVTGTTTGDNTSILAYDKAGASFSTVGMTSAALEWNQAYNFNSGTIGKVEISTDGGTTYQTLIEYDGPGNLGNTTKIDNKVSINLKDYMGRSKLNIRFYYLGTSGSNWAIDDVKLVGNFLPVNYSWGTGETTQSITVTPTNNTTSATTTTYTLSSNTGSCAATNSSITITVNPLPTATITAPPAVCQNAAQPSITFTGTGGTAPYTFTYNITKGSTTGSDTTVVSGSGTNPVSVGVPVPTGKAGTYTYKLVSIKGQFCSNPQNGSATITVNPLPTITGTLTICSGSKTQLTGSPTAATTNPWVSSNNAVATVDNSGLVTGVAAGTTTITYTNSNGCTATATVAVNALPTITGTFTVCSGSTTQLTGSPTAATTNPWVSSNTAVATVSNSGLVTGVAAGTTTITYTNTNGCTATATVTVSARPTITGTLTVCAGSTTQLTGSPTAATSKAWVSSNTAAATVDNNGSVTGVSAGTATITYTNSNGCTATATVTVNPTPAPTIAAQGANPTCTGSVVLQSSSASTYQWYKDGNQILLATQQQYIATAEGSYTVTVTNSSGCSGSSQPFNVTFITSSWTAGALTSDWNNPLNWCSGKVPTRSTDASIPNGVTPYPVLSGDTAVRSLTIQSGASVTLNGKTLTVYGNVSGSGQLTGSSNSGLVFSGTNTSTLYLDSTNDASTNVLGDLTIKSGTVTIANNTKNKLYLTGVLSLNGGIFNTSGKLTLRSTSVANTARVAPVSGTINGSVTVERFIPARRAFRFLSPSVTTSTSIQANWMEGGHNPSIDPAQAYNPHPGFGTNITGRDPLTNGFDPTITTNPSIFTFNTTTQRWDSIPNSNIALSTHDAYSLMVRGDRSIDMRTNTPTATNTILRATGTLKTGGYSPALSSTALNYTFIGNPYASPVDFTKMLAAATNVNPSYYAWDPNINERGAYVSYNATYNINSNPFVSKVDKNIQSGQAVFVQNANGGAASIQFQEAYKTTGNTAVFRDPHQITKLSIQLLLNQNDGLQNCADGAMACFDKNFSTALGDDDSYKFTNLDENLAINHNDTSLSIEGRPPVTADDTIRLKMWQFRQNSYYLKLKGSNFSPDVTAFVNDNYLHKLTPVDLSSVTLLPFSIDTANAASAAKDRFSIVFKAATALPVTLTNVKAYQKEDGIQVDWTAEAETNIESYQVEKSVNGQQFDKAAAIPAKGNNAGNQMYGWYDENAVTGTNFYRIKVIEKSGAIKYSNVVRVNIAEVKGSLTVFPNPIKDNLIKVQFSNMEKGRYSVVLYNTLGQRLYSSTIDHIARSGTYTISLGRLISKGTYTLHISKGETTMNERVVVE